MQDIRVGNAPGRWEAGGLPQAAELADRLGRRSATIAVIGLGYVGLPTADLLGSRGSPSSASIPTRRGSPHCDRGRSYIRHVRLDALWRPGAEGRFAATGDFARLGEADAVLICVPTPLDGDRKPDLGFVRAAAARIAEHLRPGMLVVLESTSYPGTCREVVRPILEAQRASVAARTSSSPIRRSARIRAILDYATATIPRVVGGDGSIALDLACALYRALVVRGRPGCVDRGRGGRQDYRERVPRRQYRARERAQDHLRRHGHRRLAGHRRRQQQAVRLHAVLPRTRARRPLRPGRSLLSRLEGARARHAEPVHRAGRRDQHDMPRRVVERLAREIGRGAWPRPGRTAASCSSAWPTSATSTTCGKVPACG